MGSVYIYIYLFFWGVILIGQNNIPSAYSPFKYGYKGTAEKSVLILMILCSLFIGLRPVDKAFADMVGYNNKYTSLMGVPYSFEANTENLIFDQLIPLFASFNLSPEYFFTLISFVYFGCMFIACRKIFPNNLLVSYIACLTAFSAFSYATNGIKAGAAASIFLLAIAYREKKIFAALLILISWGFHHSMSVVATTFLISFLFKKTKLYFYIWGTSIVIAAAHITYFQTIFADWTDEKGSRYLLTTSDSFVTGFRPDFILYSAMPILIGYFFLYKKKVQDSKYEFLLRLYTLTNSVWMVSMYASFNNRIAYLSWFMYPIVLIYPYLSIQWCQNQTRYAKRVITYHYAFTLLMTAVYYTLIKT